MSERAGPSRGHGEHGLTLIELVLASALLGILAAAAMPLYEVTVRREREIELRRSLRELRRALDAFHASYVASGGALSQGGSSTAPLSSGPTASQPLGSATPNNRTGSVGTGNQPQQPQPGMGGPNGDIPLIDASQYDPIDSKGFPPMLAELVDGVQAFGGGTDDEDKIYFLRTIPRDPMMPKDLADSSGDEKNFGWAVRCYGQKRGESWCGKNVWDVYSKSRGKALDGKSRYDQW